MTCDTFRRYAKERIVIQSGTLVADGYGGSTRTWGTVAGAWAVITPTSGREILQAEQLQSRVTHKFLIRYRSIFKATATIAKYRVLFDDRYYSVQYVRNLDRDMKNYGHAYQEIYTEESTEDAA